MVPETNLPPTGLFLVTLRRWATMVEVTRLSSESDVNNKSSQQEEKKISNGGRSEEDEILDGDAGMALSSWLGGGHHGCSWGFETTMINS